MADGFISEQDVPGTTLAMLNNLLHWDEQYGERDFYGYYRRASELGQINPGMGYWRRVTDNQHGRDPEDQYA